MGGLRALVPPCGSGEPSPPQHFPTEQLTYPGELLLRRLSWHSLCLPDWSEPLQQREQALWLEAQLRKQKECPKTTVHSGLKLHSSMPSAPSTATDSVMQLQYLMSSSAVPLHSQLPSSVNPVFCSFFSDIALCSGFPFLPHGSIPTCPHPCATMLPGISLIYEQI